jgi:hypothetical protein
MGNPGEERGRDKGMKDPLMVSTPDLGFPKYKGSRASLGYIKSSHRPVMAFTHIVEVSSSFFHDP